MTEAFVIPTNMFQVASWIPDGREKPDQVHLRIGLGQDALIIRLKSREVIEELVDALLDHANEVWPVRGPQVIEDFGHGWHLERRPDLDCGRGPAQE